MNKVMLYTASVARRNPTARPEALERLISIARSLHRIYERQCNGHQDGRGNWDEQAAKRDDVREGRLEAEAHKIAAELGALLYVQGDPRGLPLSLYFPGDLPDVTPETVERDGGWHGIGVPL